MTIVEQDGDEWKLVGFLEEVQDWISIQKSTCAKDTIDLCPKKEFSNPKLLVGKRFSTVENKMFVAFMKEVHSVVLEEMD